MKDLNKVIKELGKKLLNEIDLPQTSKYVFTFPEGDKTHAGTSGDCVTYRDTGTTLVRKRSKGNGAGDEETTFFRWFIKTKDVSEQELEIIIKELFEAKTSDILEAADYYESLQYSMCGTEHPLGGNHYQFAEGHFEPIQIFFTLHGIPKTKE